MLTLGALGACAAIAGLEEPGEGIADAGDDTSPTPANDATPPANDAGPSTAKFELLCNGKPLDRHTCPKKRWEHDRCGTVGDAGRSLVLHNTGEYAIAYIARRNWGTITYTPGVATDGGAGEQTGIVAPNARVELAGSYNGGTFAIFGAVKPFAEAARATPLDDEGRVKWPRGDLGGIPTDEIDVAQMTVTDTSECWNILAPTDRRHFD